MVGDPFEDNIEQGQQVVFREAHHFISIFTRIGGSIQAPPDTAFEVDVDSATGPFMKIEKVEGGTRTDVTAQWVTKTLDPSDSEDVYNGSHATYVGTAPVKSSDTADLTSGSTTVTTDEDVFTAADKGKIISGNGIASGTTIATVTDARNVELSQAATGTFTDATINFGKENIGLFHDGAGAIAQKVQVPAGALITTSTNDYYEIFWKVRKSDGNILSSSEVFNVDEAGVILFQNASVTVSQVTAAINTTLTDGQIIDIIGEANRTVQRMFRRCGIDPLTNENVTVDLIDAVIFWARGLITIKNPSATQPVTSVTQKSKTKRFAQSAVDRAADWLKMAADVVAEACEDEGDEDQVSAQVQVRDFWHEALP